ncbi:transcriptional regulator [Sporosarcina sp. resist]|uniref:CopG family transcriptional regulator/antitoxin EndoAI n=1 Tax=Sporosarcina psychrophila TaxID=1476 RepID=A0ABV2K7Y0_SPOPS|nr:transcriptional regulator [Sporosarcina psychrophila]QNK88671.1 transcriptional regulator [Sporosarcina sp. resist]
MSEVLTLRANKNFKEVIVKIPKRMLNENEHTVVHQELDRGDFVYISTKRYVTDYESDTIREEMMNGYLEMSQINLRIATECLHVEFEAQHTVERLVSGG